MVVFVDASLALIEKKQREMDYTNVGVDMAETDFTGIARATSGRGVTVEDRENLAVAIEEALEIKDRYTLISCKIPRASYDGKI